MQKKIYDFIVCKCKKQKNLKKRAKSGIDQECEGSLIAEYVKIWYTCTK